MVSRCPTQSRVCSADDANKPETALYRAPTFFLLASHGGVSSCHAYCVVYFSKPLRLLGNSPLS